MLGFSVCGSAGVGQFPTFGGHVEGGDFDRTGVVIDRHDRSPGVAHTVGNQHFIARVIIITDGCPKESRTARAQRNLRRGERFRQS